MKKSDLKTGMIVETREGNEYIVFINTCKTESNPDINNVLVGQNNKWLNLYNYNENMEHINGEFEGVFDIVKVYIPYHPFTFTNITYQKEDRRLIWERDKKIKEVTLKELEEYFGYRIKIVDS